MLHCVRIEGIWYRLAVIIDRKGATGHSRFCRFVVSNFTNYTCQPLIAYDMVKLLQYLMVCITTAAVLGCNPDSLSPRQQRRIHFQGTWAYPEQVQDAFRVEGDSLYFRGRPSGFPYRFRGDTLEVTFAKAGVIRYPILTLTDTQLRYYDPVRARDTVYLEKLPTAQD